MLVATEYRGEFSHLRAQGAFLAAYSTLKRADK